MVLGRLRAMEQLLPYSLEDTDQQFVPGRYADDAKVLLVFASGLCFAAAIAAYLFDGWPDAVFFLLQAIWMLLMYLVLEKRHG